MNYRELYISLCDDAYPNEKGGRRKKGRKPNPLACAECESPCVWGIELLKTIDEQEYRSLLCGADCDTCRQPCNLRRITQMRGIEWVTPQKKKIQKSWMHVAMRPYWERHGRPAKATEGRDGCPAERERNRRMEEEGARTLKADVR